jgi:hypothetical protein
VRVRQVGGDVIPTGVRWYSTQGIEHRPVATTVGTGAVRWHSAAVCPADIGRPMTLVVDAGGVRVSQGTQVLFTTQQGHGRPTLVAFKNASLDVEFRAAVGGGAVPEWAPAPGGAGAGAGSSWRPHGTSTAGSSLSSGSGFAGGAGSTGAGRSGWSRRSGSPAPVTRPVGTSKQAEADARKRKAEARRVKRAARKAAAAAVEVEYDSDTEDLLRLGALARCGGGSLRSHHGTLSRTLSRRA